MKVLKTFFIIAATLMLAACVSENIGSDRGKETTANVKTSDFRNISITGSSTVYFVQGNKTSVKMHGKEQDIKEMDIQNINGTLKIKTKRNNGWNLFSRNNTGDVEIYITSPNLRNVEIIGSGDFIADGKIDTDIMKISISGSGDTKIKDIICNSISVKIAGSGDVDIKKISTTEATLTISGSGDICMNNVNIGYVESKIAGSGSIRIKGKVKSHKEKISGSGDVSIN